MKITPVGKLQIHIIARAEFRIQVGTATEEGEMILTEHSCDAIGASQDVAICALVKKWSTDAVMRITPMGIGVFLLIKGGIHLRQVHIRENENSYTSIRSRIWRR